MSPNSRQLGVPNGYRPCAGIAVFNNRGLVLACKRIGLEKGQYAWQLPQGGLDDRETPESAARRELFEETGVRSVQLLDEIDDWLTYDFPPDILGKQFKKYRGQAQRWFAYGFDGSDTEIDLNVSKHIEFDDWDWVSLNSLPTMIVPFKRGVYEAMVAAFQPIAIRRGARGFHP